MMTAATFTATATAIRATVADILTRYPDDTPADNAPRIAAMSAIESLADMLAAQYAAANPRFDRARFYAACGRTMSADGFTMWAVTVPADPAPVIRW